MDQRIRRQAHLYQALRRHNVRSAVHVDRCPVRVCAVQRRRFPVGASPTRQPLQPEAIGAVMEVTKWLKPSISVSRIGDSASVAGRNASERRASLEKDNAQADPTTLSGKADTAG